MTDFLNHTQHQPVGLLIALHLNKIQEGSVIDVKVDIDDPQKIYPANSWAVYTEGYSSDLSVDKLEGR